MTLADRINQDMKEAMKNQDKLRLGALRSVKSALLLAQSEKGPEHELSEEAELNLLKKLVKQRKESAEIYKSKGKDELYQQEMAEKEVIEEYLPEQLSEEEITEQLKAIIDEMGASDPSQMGKVMGVATKKLAGKADNKFIAQKVKELLS